MADIYEAKVWDKAAENSKGVLEEFKPFQSIPGGSIPIDINDHVIGLALFAVDEYNKKQNTVLKFKVVMMAEKQVLQEFMYYITLKVVDEGKNKIYEAKVLEKAGTNSKELKEFKPFHSIPGGSIPIDINDHVIDLALFAVDEYNKKQNTVLEFKKVMKAKEQVLEDSLYYITLEVVDKGKNKGT